ncbi:hypothetical protein [Microvirga splendida]|uniref:Glycosyltransferase RgtA/B/C/D-like domain-containing protein n=1 Tax=Microvirga splendida TaxID=2795727 RepID=A0ABS0XVB4_9HYPH|nr:hypothetical protein [Microvirga splendida]MBJ6123962.1 hypothetical protein [Microvirga splendida]
MRLWTERPMKVGPILLAAAALLALLLALPGQTVTTRYLNDLFVILDGAYRVAAGQVPNQDFHTPLGPFAYYLTAAGYFLSGTLGGTMPTAMALITLVLALPMAHILGSRLHPLLAVLYGLFLLLILAVPVNLGESVTSLSFAKFYNRIGWAALGALLVMYLQPLSARRRQTLLDTACAAALTLLMLYTKLSYGVVALAFLLFMLLDRQQRRWSASALGITILAVLVIELIWQSSLAHLADLRLAFDVGGSGLRGTWGQIIDHVLVNLTDYVLLGLFAGIALYRTHSVRDLLFYAFCAIAGFLIVNQNFQAWGIIMLHGAAAVAAETILRSEDHRPQAVDHGSWSTGAGAKLLFLAVVLPTIIHCLAALGLHTAAASVKAGNAVPLPNLEQVRVANLWTWSDYDTAAAYQDSLRDGFDALSNLDPKPDRIFVLDTGNPFSMALGAPPARGDTPWLQWDRTLGRANHVPAEALLADVQFVMVPKTADTSDAAIGPLPQLQAIYGHYIAAHFDAAGETQHWTLYRRRPPPAPEAALQQDGRS